MIIPCLPKIAFGLRTCLIQHALVAFDDAMRDALSDLPGYPLADLALYIIAI